MKKTIATDFAPKAIGPYAQGIKAGEWVFVSGQLPIDPATGKMVEGDANLKARQALKNVEAILKASSLEFKDVVRMEIFLLSMADFAAVNEECKKIFETSVPARQTVAVAELPLGASIEISVIAIKCS